MIVSGRFTMQMYLMTLRIYTPFLFVKGKNTVAYCLTAVCLYAIIIPKRGGTVTLRERTPMNLCAQYRPITDDTSFFFFISYLFLEKNEILCYECCLYIQRTSGKEADLLNDASIIKLLFERNEKAVEELKQSYEKLCFYIAGNILSQKEDQEECVNSAYMEVWTSIPPNKPDNLKTYLCRLVKNCALNRWKYNTAAKRNQNFSVSLDELSECIPDGKCLEETVSEDQLGVAISEFLMSQPEKYRKVFVRRYWYSDTLEDIAAIYDMDPRTVATYLFRVRKKLKAFLKKEGYIDE